MSLLNDLIFFENPTIWNDFGGSDCLGCGGYSGVVWQMFFWSLIVGLLVAAWMTYNLIYFRHADGDPDHDDALKAGVFPHERGNPKIEIAWTIAPLILVSWLTLISLGPLDYMWDVDGQEADITIEVVASQWWWSFGTPICNEEKADKEDWCSTGIYQEPEGFDQCETSKARGCLEIPHDAVIHFRLTSVDVLHAFNFPELGIKQDVVPNLETLTWLDARTFDAGHYSIWCAEYCGREHAIMDADIFITEVA